MMFLRVAQDVGMSDAVIPHAGSCQYASRTCGGKRVKRLSGIPPRKGKGKGGWAGSARRAFQLEDAEGSG
ncbi:MAG: hypothetical protein DBY37_08745 [Desulfovibrionaceae bacterium]|nr:MAG: hypothetical protein DBY37_13575 [Desulfovibrionaceae bacterium]PWL60153.1 MAG: hypothetical protein DBY37_08745 [Desulfovibrionaceae bacterium]